MGEQPPVEAANLSSTDIIDQILQEHGLSLTELLNLDQSVQQEILDKLGKEN